MQTKTFPGADCSSDHNPVVVTIRIKLKRITKKELKPRKDYEALRSNKVLQEEYKRIVQDKYRKLQGKLQGCIKRNSEDISTQACKKKCKENWIPLVKKDEKKGEKREEKNWIPLGKKCKNQGEKRREEEYCNPTGKKCKNQGEKRTEEEYCMPIEKKCKNKGEKRVEENWIPLGKKCYNKGEKREIEEEVMSKGTKKINLAQITEDSSDDDEEMEIIYQELVASSISSESNCCSQMEHVDFLWRKEVTSSLKRKAEADVSSQENKKTNENCVNIDFFANAILSLQASAPVCIFSKSDNRSQFQVDQAEESRKRKQNQDNINSAKRCNFNAAIENESQMPSGTPNEDWSMLQTAMVEAEQEVIPNVKRKSRNKWMTAEILNLMDKRREVKDEDEDRYKELDKLIKKKCKKAKEDWLQQQCLEIQKLKNRDTPTMYEKINMLSGKYKKRNNWAVKDKNGKLLINEEDTLNRWEEYTKELFDDNRGEKPNSRRVLEGPKIMKDEVIYAMKSMKRKKSPGNDNIRIEMIDALEDFGVDTLTSLANKIYDTGMIPDEMCKSIFIAIPKKPKAVDCDKHRIISLMSQITKLILRILLNRARSKIRDKVSEVQYGFRPGKGTRNAIFIVRMLAERAIQMRKDLYLCFVDYEKAFDRVHHHEMIKLLEEISLDSKDIRVITNLYWKNKAAFKVGNELSDWMEIKRGVRQGCVLSPDLFALYGEKIRENIEEDEGIIVGVRNINNIRYADDTVLIADSREKLQRLLSKLSRASEEKGLSINLLKTEVLVTSKEEIPPECKIYLEREENFHEIKQVNSFEYLGSFITSDGRSDKEIKRRIGLAKSSFNNMKNILTNRKLDILIRKQVLKTYIWSKMLYGCESWTLSNDMKAKLQAAEMWFYRRMLRSSWKDFKTNEDILRLAKDKRQLLLEIKSRQMAFLGHIMRHSDIEKLALTGRIAGSRGRGRPRKTFMNNFEELGETANEVLNQTSDRIGWRKRKIGIVRLRVKKPMPPK